MAPEQSAALEQGREQMRAAVAGHLDGEVVAVSWFRSPGSWEGAGGGLKRVFKNVFSRSDAHASERLAAMNVLAVTPDRIVAFTAATGLGGLKIKKRIGEWPRDAVQVGARRRIVEPRKSNAQTGLSDSLGRWDIMPVTLQAKGDPRVLRMEFHADAVTDELVAALKAGGAPR